jgi:hypothetical protein
MKDKIIDFVVNSLKVMVCFLISLVISILVYGKTGESFISTMFLINYFGVFLGIILAIISFIYSVIRDEYEAQPRIKDIFTELRDDTMLVFYLFVLSLALYVIERVNIVIILYGWNLATFGIEVIRNFMLLLSLMAIYDIIQCMFIIIFGTDNGTD